MRFSILAPAVLLLVVACSESEFKASGNRASDDSATKPMGDDQTGDPPQVTENDQTGKSKDGLTGGGDDGSGLDGDAGVIKPQICDATSIKIYTGSGKCEANMAVYAMDDADNARISCCPLPARDILLTAASAKQSRTTSCGPNEVMTGVIGGNTYECTAINTAKYKLIPAGVCYNGSGASGGQGSRGCVGPPATMTALVANFGSDACLGYPFGSLFTARGNKRCSSMKAMSLLLIDGSPITMFE